MSTALPLIVGEYYTREDLVIEYGGSVQSGGIVPGNKSNTVFVFTDPSEGAQFGYVYDGFSSDGSVLYYTGAGQNGDQVVSGANSPIVTHAEKGRTLHAFVAAGRMPGRQTKRQRYVGEFVLDPALPFERMPALDRNHAVRTVLVFRLLPVRPVDESMLRTVGISGITGESKSLLVPVELNSTYFFETSGTEARTAVRRESRLVDDFIASQSGHEFSRWAIKVPKEPPLLTDVYDETDRVLYEAKALARRSDVRMAVGQLYDYRRHVDVDNLRCAVLLPERPRADLRDLLQSAGLGLAFRSGDKFEVLPASSRVN
jgi:hypothetical protein